MKRAVLAAILTLAAPPAFAATQIHWTIMGQTAVSFDWVGSETKIYYSTVKGRVSTLQAGVDSATSFTPSPLPWNEVSTFAEARITGLTENTLYYYKIGAAAESALVHTFRTPPPRGSSGFTIAVAGDMGDTLHYAGLVAGVNDLILASQPRFVLLVGDLTYANGGSSHNGACITRHFNNVMKWSQDAAYMPAWGNHEWDKCSSTDASYFKDDLRNYKGRFDLPNPKTDPHLNSSASGWCSGNNGVGEDWYWFDYGNARFIAFPEPLASNNSTRAWRDTASALMESVRNDPDIKFVVVFGHRQIYSSGHHDGVGTGSFAGFVDTLRARHPKFVLFLNGHSHNYERTNVMRGQLTYITSGGGGGNLDDETTSCGWMICPQPDWSAYRAFATGPTILTFESNRIVGKQLCGPQDDIPNQLDCTLGTEIDAFTIAASECACAVPN